MTKFDNSVSNWPKEKLVDAVAFEDDVAGVAVRAALLRDISVFVKCSIR